MGMLAVGFRIMPPWIGRFMAPVVAAQVTLTAELGGAHSPEGMVGREVLLPIIPACKAEDAERCRHRKQHTNKHQTYLPTTTQAMTVNCRRPAADTLPGAAGALG